MSRPPHSTLIFSPGLTLEKVEEWLIRHHLHHNRGNKTSAAHALGCSVRTLDSRLEQYDVAETRFNREVADDKKKREEQLLRARGFKPPEDPKNPPPVDVKTVADIYPEPTPDVAMLAARETRRRVSNR